MTDDAKRPAVAVIFDTAKSLEQAAVRGRIVPSRDRGQMASQRPLAGHINLAQRVRRIQRIDKCLYRLAEGGGLSAGRITVCNVNNFARLRLIAYARIKALRLRQVGRVLPAEV